MTSEDRQRLNLRTITTTFRAAMASAPHLAEEHRKRTLQLLERARGSATEAVQAEIDDARSRIAGTGRQRTG